MVSHFDWKDDTTILAWARTKKDGNKFYTVDVLTGETKVVGADVLTQDGHCSYSPDRKWILNDTYPDKDRMQTLMLFRAQGRPALRPEQVPPAAEADRPVPLRPAPALEPRRHAGVHRLGPRGDAADVRDGRGLDH